MILIKYIGILSTLLMVVLFTGVVLWAYSGKRARAFAEAEMLPFADEPRATGEEELPQ